MHRWIILFVAAIFLDIILKFSKTVTLEFSDSPIQILVFFLSRKTVGRATRTKNFLDDRLMLMLSLKKTYRMLYFHIVEKLSQLAFFMTSFFTLVVFDCSTLYKTLVLFLEKLKISRKACFYIILQNFYRQLFNL